MSLALSSCRASNANVERWMDDDGTDVKRLCLMLLKDAAMAEDAPQETFFKA